MNVIEHTRRSAVAVEVDTPISDVARTMEVAAVGAVAVQDRGDLVGIVTDRDLILRWLAHRLDPSARVDGVMSSPVVTIDATAESVTPTRFSPPTPSAGWRSSTRPARSSACCRSTTS